VRFWDSSAIVPIVVVEPMSQALRELAHDDPAVVMWWATTVETLSALYRRVRMGELDASGLAAAQDRLRAFLQDAHVVAPGEPLRERAHRLLGVHPLRAADALQLAAALVWAEERPIGLELVTLDDRLCDAASREGFRVLP